MPTVVQDVSGDSALQTAIAALKAKIEAAEESGDIAQLISDINTALASKQNTLAFDSTPTAGSSNPVTSGGVKTALDAKQDTLTFDNEPTTGSTKPVTSGGVYEAVSKLKSALSAYEGGTTGQVLRKKSATDNDVEWSNVGALTDAQVGEGVAGWLDEHPEAITTVQDGSLTAAKFSEGLTILAIKDYATPEMYGAVGDGVADDTAAIQAAVNAKSNVYFSQKTYKITEPILLSYGANIVGASKYRSVIKAMGCDAFHITNGDSGERGSIKNLRIEGDYTTGSKGIVLPYLAPGWVIEDNWINAFDYGIYGYNLGNINNIYIVKCIITGNDANYNAMTCGIQMQNTNTSQINAITIRDCEINSFATGIMIGGTAISIVQNTIQNCDFGIVSDAGYCNPTSNYVNTLGMTINGCYMELIRKSCIYLSTVNQNSSGTRQAGHFNGVQITNNYLYKINGDNTYAMIKLSKSEEYKYAANTGNSLGLQFAGFMIAMNHFSKPDACKAYDMKKCLSADSIVMDSNPGATVNWLVRENDSIISSGASVFSDRFIKKIQANVSSFLYYKSTGVTIVDEHTIQLDNNSVFIMYINTGKLTQWSFTVTANEYPCKLKYATLFRTRKDGLLHDQKYINGEYQIQWEDNSEYKDWSQDYGYSTIQETKRNVIAYSSNYHMAPSMSWNDFSGYALVLHSKNETPITISMPMIEMIS